MSKQLKGHLLAILTVSIWSSTFIVSKFLLQYLSPLHILFIRFVISVVFLSILYPRFTKMESLKEELLFLVIGVCLALYFYFENSALLHTYSSNVSLIVATIPLITGAFSAIIYKTNFFNKKSIFGFLLAYVGVFCIILNGSKLAGVEPIGDLLALFAAILFAAYTLAMQRIPNRYHLIELTRKVMLYGLFVLLIIILVSREGFDFEVLNTKVIGYLLFLGIVASSLAFIMWNKSINLIGSVRTNQYIYLTPVITTIFSAILIDEKITIITVLGTGLILFGLFLSEKANK